MPKSKIVIGIPTFGWGWTLTHKEKHEIGSPGRKSKPTKFVKDDGVGAYYEVIIVLFVHKQLLRFVK